jgi:hypothetical protein
MTTLLDDPYTVDVSLVPAIPLKALAQPCTLTLTAHHIVCRRLDGTIVCDGSPHDFHSYAPFGALGADGFHLWYRDKRFRFVNRVPPGMSRGALVSALRTIPQVTAIRSSISPVPPDGVVVTPPLSHRTTSLLNTMLVLTALGATVLLFAIAKSVDNWRFLAWFTLTWVATIALLGVLTLGCHRRSYTKRTDNTN